MSPSKTVPKWLSLKFCIYLCKISKESEIQIIGFLLKNENVYIKFAKMLPLLLF